MSGAGRGGGGGGETHDHAAAYVCAAFAAVVVVGVAVWLVRSVRRGVGFSREPPAVPVRVGAALLWSATTLAVAGTGVALAVSAGQRALAVAADAGGGACDPDAVVPNAVVNALARAHVVAAVARVDDLLAHAADASQTAAAIFAGLPDGSWGAFAGMLHPFAGVAAVQAQRSSLRVRVDTNEGYLATSAVATDGDAASPPYGLRTHDTTHAWPPAAVAPFADEGAGYLELVRAHYRAMNASSSSLRGSLLRIPQDARVEGAQFYTQDMRGGVPAAGAGVGHMLALVAPVLRGDTVAGAATVCVAVAEIAQLLASAARLLAVGVVQGGNTTHAAAALPTLALLTRPGGGADWNVVASNAVGAQTIALGTGGPQPRKWTRLHSLRAAPVAELRGLAGVLGEGRGSNSDSRSRIVTFTLNASTVETDSTAIHIGNNHNSASMWAFDAAATALAVDPVLQRRVFVMSGAAPGLRVGRHLTASAPAVAATSAGDADGSWNSTEPWFRGGLAKVAGGTMCVRQPSADGDMAGGAGPCYARREELGSVTAARDERVSVSMVVKPQVAVDGVGVDATVRDVDDVDAADGNAGWLFSASPTDRTPLRLYADGRVAMDPAAATCATAPLLAGIPKHAWTTLSVVVDVAAGYCALYVNGSLHSRGDIAHNAPLTEVSTTLWHTVGHRWHGAVGSIVVHEHALSAKAVEEVHKDLLAGGSAPGLVAEGTWTAAVEAVCAACGDDDMALAVLVRHADAAACAGAADESAAAVLAARAAFDRDADTAAASAALVAVLMLGLVLVWVDHAAAPLGVLHDLLAGAAVAPCDGARTTLKASYVSEIRAVSAALTLMLDRTKELMCFLPQSLLADIAAMNETDTRMALVACDIANSPSLWTHAPQGMARAMEIYNQVVRTRAAQFDGREIKVAGDMITLTMRPLAACRFALAAQHDLGQVQWASMLAGEAASNPLSGVPGVGPQSLSVRMGVASSDAARAASDGGRRHGAALAIEVARQCMPGAVCITGQVCAQVDLAHLDDDIVCMDMGQAALWGDTVGLHMLVPSSNKDLMEAAEYACASAHARSVAPLMKSMSSMSFGSFASSDVSSFETASYFNHTAPPVACPLREHLQRVTGTIARTSIRYTGPDDVVDVDNPLGHIRDCLAHVFDAAQQTRGTVVTLLGASVSVSWCMTRTLEHVRSGFQYVRRLSTTVDDDDVMCMFTGLASGAVLRGNVGGGIGYNQRHAVVIGAAMSLASTLAFAAAKVEVHGLYATLAQPVPVLVFPVLRRYVRPIDVLCVENSNEYEPSIPVTVYQVQAEGCPDGEGADGLRSISQPVAATLRGWGDEYWQAFEAKDIEKLSQYAQRDHVVAQVIDQLRDGLHIIQGLPRLAL